jgi:hypothetical protein
MAYQTNLLGDFWTSYTQRRRTGGRPLTRREVGGLLDPLYASEAQKSIAAGARAEERRRFDLSYNLQKEAMDRQQRAATISGLTQLPLTYGVAKQAGVLPEGFELLKPSTWGGGGVGPANEAAKTALGGTGIANTGGIAGMFSTPASPFAGVGPLSEFAGVGTGAPPAAAGIGAAVGPGLLGGAAGYGLSKILGANEDISQGLTYGAAGVAAGAAIGGPVGAAIGGLIGLGVSFLDDIF